MLKTTRRYSVPALVLALLLGGWYYARAVTNTFVDGTVISATAVNQNFTDLQTQINALVPQGTIVAFGGSSAPPGWLLCDGSSVSNATYPVLFAAIGTAWGGNGAPNFNLPDLRGRFLRGWNNGAGVDPDAAARTNLAGNATLGDVVGSVQPDAFQGHYHNVYADNLLSTGMEQIANNTAGNSNNGLPLGAKARDAVSDGTNGTPRVTSETRPKNAYVNYIIKY